MNKYHLKKNQIINLLKKIHIKLKSENIDLINSEGRFLSSDITSKIDLPPFNNSAVDGYAIHIKNLKNQTKLKCTRRIAAGDNKAIFLKNNEAVRIFTGARMPKNSKTVVMQENTINENNKYILIKKYPKEGENCRLKGEDISKGKKILKNGDIINANNLNLLAAIGKSKITVKKKLKVGFFTSGNELKKPSELLRKAEINDSNRYLLKSLLKDNFLEASFLGVLKDSKKKIINSFDKFLAKYNVIITAGGASVGEEDHLIKVLIEKGKIFFWKTAIKPGRPLAIGKINKTIIICLPGNPVSVHLLYAMIVKPFLKFICSNQMILPQSFDAYVNFNMTKKTNRLEWLRVTIDKRKLKNIYVNKFPKQGSGMISSIAFSDGIIEIPENVSIIKKGDKFKLYLYNSILN